MTQRRLPAAYNVVSGLCDSVWAPCLSSFACKSFGLAAPTFEAMFADFGSDLPTFTEVVIHGRVLWMLFSVAGIGVTIFCVRQELTRDTTIALVVCGLMEFLVAQTLTVGFFLPILELGKVAGDA